MARIGFLLLGLAVGFGAASILHEADDTPRRERESGAAGSLPWPDTGTAPAGTAADDALAESNETSPGARAGTTAARVVVTKQRTRDTIREIYRAEHEGTEPPADLLDAAADEAERSVQAFRERELANLARSLEGRAMRRDEIGYIEGSPILLQGRTDRLMDLDPTSGFRARWTMQDTPLDVRVGATAGEQRAYVRGGTVPPGKAFVVERIRVVMTLEVDGNGRRSSFEFDRDWGEGLKWEMQPGTIELELRGVQVIEHGWEHRRGVRLRCGSMSVELHGRLVGATEAAAIAPVPFLPVAGDGLLGDGPVVLQVLAAHGGGNPNTVDLAGNVNMYVGGYATLDLWSGGRSPAEARESLVYVHGAGRVPAGMVFVVRGIDYRARLTPKDRTSSWFSIRLDGKEVASGNAEENPEGEVAGSWSGTVEIHPGEEKKLSATAAMHAILEVTVTGTLASIAPGGAHK